MTKEELAAVLAEHKAWLEGNGGKRANLAYARLVGARLVDARLAYASLVDASLADARLDGARLDGARLVDARLAYARLDGASLVGARLDGASLAYARLAYARLDGASLVGARLDGARLDGARLDGARLDGAKINAKTAIGILRRATRSDGYEFFLWHCQEGYFIKAGCRFLDMEAARQHWNNTRQGTALGDESLDILDFFAAAIKRQEVAQ